MSAAVEERLAMASSNGMLTTSPSVPFSTRETKRGPGTYTSRMTVDMAWSVLGSGTSRAYATVHNPA